MSVDNSGAVSLVFNGPDIINGISITVYDTVCKIEVQNISETYPIDQIPQDSPALLIYNALKTISDTSPTTSNGEIVANLLNKQSNYILTLDSTGFITAIKTKDLSIEIVFSNHCENQ